MCEFSNDVSHLAAGDHTELHLKHPLPIAAHSFSAGCGSMQQAAKLVFEMSRLRGRPEALFRDASRDQRNGRSFQGSDNVLMFVMGR